MSYVRHGEIVMHTGEPFPLRQVRPATEPEFWGEVSTKPKPIGHRLHTALRPAKVPENMAEAAIAEVAGFANQIAAIEGQLRLISWLVGLQTALTAALLFWLLFHVR